MRSVCKALQSKKEKMRTNKKKTGDRKRMSKNKNWKKRACVSVCAPACVCVCVFSSFSPATFLSYADAGCGQTGNRIPCWCPVELPLVPPAVIVMVAWPSKSASYKFLTVSRLPDY